MTAENFQSCLAFTLKYEGGKSDDPRDPGGRTNQGVTQRTYDAFRANLYRDVYEMTNSERDVIYRNEYWRKVTGDSLPAGVDLCVFDYGVNSGPARALRAYATVGRGKGTAATIQALCGARLSFLHALRTWSYFGTGWSKRVAACEAAALKMAGASLETASDEMRAKKRGAGATGALMTGAAIATVFKIMGHHWALTAGAVLISAIAILWAIGKSRHAGIRADALEAAISELKAKRSSLEQTTTRVIAQTAADTAAILRKQEAIQAAETAIDQLGAKSGPKP